MAYGTWMICSACRTEIGFGAKHYVCSVSTCNRARTKLVFCSVGCWDSHLAVLRHREAWAVEAFAPTREQWQEEETREIAPTDPTPNPAPLTRDPTVTQSHAQPQSRPSAPAPPSPPPPRAPTPSGITPGATAPAPLAPLAKADESDILIVVSKMKKYIRERSGMNTSDAVAAALSDHVRAICDLAIRTAGADGRKTVLDRDVPPVRR